MQLQVALDLLTLPEAIKILEELYDVIDIAEVGTPFIISDGLKAVTEIKKKFPSLQVLADLKIMDAGMHEAKMAFAAGADIVTVLGVSNDSTIKATVEQAQAFGKRIMVDLIEVNDLQQRIKELNGIMVDYVAVHTAFDIQSSGMNPLNDLRKIKEAAPKARVAVAGGVKLETLGAIVKENPEIIIVGGGITGRPNKRETALEMKKIMNH